MRVLSFHPGIETEYNRFFGADSPTPEDIEAIKAADAVILPQGCRESHYLAARRHCQLVFPNYDAMHSYPGKTGQAELFGKMAVPHPETKIFPSVQRFESRFSPAAYPVVFKFPFGGEGKYVYLLQTEEDLRVCLELARQWEQKGKNGFLLQEYIPAGGRSLRAVVIGSRYYAYWRVGNTGNFYSNLARGAVIDRHSFPERREKAVAALRAFCGRTGINLAGFDFLFSETRDPELPLFLEINYCFRCHGLGGADNYQALLVQGIKEWLSECKRPQAPHLRTITPGRIPGV